jgi:putative peptide zinc metalloprotease protein
MLHGFIPTFYVDVTDIFMASRRARITNALAGPLVHLFLAGLYFWIASLIQPGLLKGFLAASGILQVQSLFVSLYPFCFLEMDGYHILVDLLGMPTLNHDSVRFVRESLWARLRDGFALGRQEAVYAAYFLLSLVSIVGFVALNVWVLMRAGQGA